MKKSRAIAIGGAAIGTGLAITTGVVYGPRLLTMASIKRMTDLADNFNLYQMNVKFPYCLDDLVFIGKHSNEKNYLEALTGISLPFLPIYTPTPHFACSAFSFRDKDNNVLMGRNYDFTNNSSALLVRCNPKHGYRSLAFTSLDSVTVQNADQSIRTRAACLSAPFSCLDGVNEKGVSIAVLSLDSKPTRQREGRPILTTALALRMVLDRAANTQEAVDLLQEYDILAIGDKDYHFFISDSKADSRVIEFDCLSKKRRMVDIPIQAVTNFYALYYDRVFEKQDNGMFGHGKERYTAITSTLHQNAGKLSKDTAWDALRVSSQKPNCEDPHNMSTQWSIVYDNTNLSADFVFRRRWFDPYPFKL